MDDQDDMNATPLGKLPMPAIQSKNDMPRGDMGASYTDILKDLQKPQQQQQMGGGGGGGGGGQMAGGGLMGGGGGGGQMGGGGLMMQQQQYPPDTSQFQQQLPGYQHAQFVHNQQAPPRQQQRRTTAGGGGRRVRFREEDEDEDDEYEYDRRGGGRSKPGALTGLLQKLRSYKSSILVTLVVFAVLMWVAPKLGQVVPQLLSPGGKFSTVGLFVLAASTGGIHRLADHYVK